MIISSGEGTSNRNGFKRLLLAIYSFLSGELGIDFRLFEALVLFSSHCLHNTCANGDGLSLSFFITSSNTVSLDDINRSIEEISF